MTKHSAEFKRCLEQVDVAGVRKLWRHVSPHLPQPATDAEALVTLHHARTQSETIALKLRAYSHRWLIDHGYPSGLPDHMKAPAERIYPRVMESVGISINSRNPVLKPINAEIRGSMENAVLDAYADGKTEPGFLRDRMKEAREYTVRKLIGRFQP